MISVGHDALCKQDGVIRNTWKQLIKRFRNLKVGKGKRVLISVAWLNLLNILYVMFTLISVLEIYTI